MFPVKNIPLSHTASQIINPMQCLVVGCGILGQGECSQYSWHSNSWLRDLEERSIFEKKHTQPNHLMTPAPPMVQEWFRYI